MKRPVLPVSSCGALRGRADGDGGIIGVNSLSSVLLRQISLEEEGVITLLGAFGEDGGRMHGMEENEVGLSLVLPVRHSIAEAYLRDCVPIQAVR